MEISWFNLLLMALFSLGHAALMIGIVNRLHGLPLAEGLLHAARKLHDLLIAAFPVSLLWFFGVHGPGLMYGGAWWKLPPVMLAYLAVCGATAAGLPVVALKRRWARPIAQQTLQRSTRHDIAGRLGYRPVGHGPHRRLLAVPGNEAFQLEVTEKHFRLPRLPPAWHGLSILHLTDLHFTGAIERAYFEEVIDAGQKLNAELIVFTGDLLDQAELIDWIPDTLGRLTAPLGCYFVLGNHDWLLGDQSPTRRLLGELGWRDAAGRELSVEYRGRSLLIAGTELPWIGTHPELVADPGEAFRILLSHTPDNIAWARRHGVDLMLSGHNHGGQVRLPLFGPVYSPSTFGCQYAAGVFWESPTLLHVSRGVSGWHPLRLGCPPEITSIVLD